MSFNLQELSQLLQASLDPRQNKQGKFPFYMSLSLACQCAHESLFQLFTMFSILRSLDFE